MIKKETGSRAVIFARLKCQAGIDTVCGKRHRLWLANHGIVIFHALSQICSNRWRNTNSFPTSAVTKNNRTSASKLSYIILYSGVEWTNRFRRRRRITVLVDFHIERAPKQPVGDNRRESVERLDCCVGNHNRCLFISALFFATSALTYSSNLTLTSVCHPFTLYRAILLPDDCSDVYKLFELGLSFVSAVYSLALAAILLLLFLQQLVLVSLGITAKEWNKLPLVSKLCLGMFANRPHSKGFCRNWTQVICWSGNPQYEQFNQEV
ncbi:unnamed protein product [Acanthoscelides obtectus]|uniref:Palmitoyltransferase n=1 Tax=Acanthoscelides obtectus TaxID=200917 RepID=A0A9P0LGY3_ACAOB|nr:unnamed protein product [Acanthoscelides obtectus]CAK1667069.1 Palmitoyltransferase ZDHHC23 [Acanthoscelides obtectus]